VKETIHQYFSGFAVIQVSVDVHGLKVVWVEVRMGVNKV